MNLSVVLDLSIRSQKQLKTSSEYIPKVREYIFNRDKLKSEEEQNCLLKYVNNWGNMSIQTKETNKTILDG